MGADDIEDAGRVGLIPTTVGHFQKMDDQSRIGYLTQTQGVYYDILKRIHTGAIEFHNKALAANKRYGRRKLIISLLTFFLAVFNGLAALNWAEISGAVGAEGEEATAWAVTLLTAFNAIYAIFLSAVRGFVKIEDDLESARSYEDASAALNHANMSYDMRWRNYVTSFGHDPEACLNASVLYSQLVEEEHRLRTRMHDRDGSSQEAEA